MPNSLTLQQARKLVLLSQNLPPRKTRGTAIAATLAAIEQLSYVQIDTISVIQRAHHHTLWNRNPRYSPLHIDQLLAEKQIFEYWSHAAAYLPMNNYRYSLPRKHVYASGKQNHWYERDHKLMAAVLKRIDDEGPLMAKDFEGDPSKNSGWGSKPTKRALENLYMQGELMIPQRRNFHKVYDLTERVLPKEIDISRPSEQEYIRFLITTYLTANGLGTATEMAYLLKNIRPIVNTLLREMVVIGQVIEVNVMGQPYYALPNSLKLLNRPLTKDKVNILSPFDNLVIQRKRISALFGFDYLLECYVPEPNRQFGYFCLPILWNGKLVARMDCKADRKQRQLNILHLAFEPAVQRLDDFLICLSQELATFAIFNECDVVHLHKTTPPELQPPLTSLLI
jgi:uncharacterized protein